MQQSALSVRWSGEGQNIFNLIMAFGKNKSSFNLFDFVLFRSSRGLPRFCHMACFEVYDLRRDISFVEVMLTASNCLASYLILITIKGLCIHIILDFVPISIVCAAVYIL